MEDSSVGTASDRKARRNTDVGSSPQRGKDFFLPESVFSADSLTVFVQPLCNSLKVCINFCAALYKPQTLGYIQMAIPLFGHTKILQTLIGMGSAALAAAVPYPGEATRISSKGQ